MTRQIIGGAAVPVVVLDATTRDIQAGAVLLVVAFGDTTPELQTLKVGDVAGGNYFYIDETGYITLVGNATVWDDLRVPISSTKLGGSKDPTFSVAFTNGSGSQGVFAYFFDNSTEEELYFSVQLPHNWKEGTAIEPHVHWFPNANGAAGKFVRWGLEYTWQSIGSVFQNTTIIYTNSTIPADASLVANKPYLSDFASISGTGQTFSSMLLCRIFRDAGNDDYAGEAGMLEIDFHFQIDSLGTNNEYS